MFADPLSERDVRLEGHRGNRPTVTLREAVRDVERVRVVEHPFRESDLAFRCHLGARDT